MAKIEVLARATTLTVIDATTFLDGKPPPEVDPDTGLPSTLQAFVVSTDPKMTVIPNFLSEAECDHLVQLVEGCWMPSLVGGAASVKDKATDFDEGTVENSVSQTRTSWSCMLRYAQDDVVDRIEHRVAKIADLPNGVAQLERFNMVRYAPGEVFNEHHDGKFRPKTVFIYLNDLLEGDEQGDTFFPVLGYAMKPSRGTAVLWLNTEDGTKEDSRMVHAARATTKSVKYGVNCFLNEKCMRELLTTARSIPVESAAIQRVSDLAEGENPVDENGNPALQIYQVSRDPKIVAIPALLSAAEVDHILEHASGSTVESSGPFALGSKDFCQIDFAATPIVEAVEKRLVAVSGQEIDHLARLRIVRPGMKEGLCNRGCGKHSMYVCLSKAEEEVYFSRLGIRFLLNPGDALSWSNVNFDSGACREEMRTTRVHRVEHGAEPAIGMDAFFHDNPLRAQQKLRHFVTDAEVYGK